MIFMFSEELMLLRIRELEKENEELKKKLKRLER